MACAHHHRGGRPLLLGRLRQIRHTRLIAAVLLALALRSLIPIGFMPAADGSLSLTICTEGLPAGMGMPGHQSHGHGAAGDDHCGFCTGFSAAPPAPLLASRFLLLAGIAVVAMTRAAAVGICLVRLPQARAPPAPL
jgi:hypothetical protein